MKSRFKKFLWASWERVAKFAVRPYYVGPELEDALEVCRRITTAHVATTLCYWKTEDATPQDVAAAYIRAMEALKEEKGNAYLSIKAPDFQFDRTCFSQILESSRKNGVQLHFDSLGPETADATMMLVAEALPQHPGIGITLPGRWRRSMADADRAVERKLSVRVVKGQWADGVKSDMDAREGFLAVIDRLAGRARYVAVATHDPSLAQEALERLLKTRTPCGVELLYGLPVKPVLQVARTAGVGVRLYLPYGHGWLPYSISQVYDNPRILWWVIRDLCGKRSVFE